MLLTFSAVLLVFLAIIPPLQRNPFYLINSAVVIGIAWFLETYCFRATPFAPKTFMLLVVVQFVTINITTFAAYYIDKRAAIRGSYRISEKNLHMLEFLGGSFGALLGQKFLRHKSKKRSYQFMFHLIVIAQFAAVFAILRFLHFI